MMVIMPRCADDSDAAKIGEAVAIDLQAYDPFGNAAYIMQGDALNSAIISDPDLVVVSVQSSKHRDVCCARSKQCLHESLDMHVWIGMSGYQGKNKKIGCTFC